MKYTLFALLAIVGAVSAKKHSTCAYPFTTKLRCPSHDGQVQKFGGHAYRAMCGFDTNDNGNDIGSGTEVDSVDQCLTLCNNSDGCIGVAMFRSSSGGNNCFLKSAIDSFDNSNGSVDSYYIVTF